MANSTLSKAKADKKDEFYTQFYDIEAEMEAYLDYNPDVFRGKTVLLPCDDPEWSNFTKYFAQNFEELGLKKLISTSVILGNINAISYKEVFPKLKENKIWVGATNFNRGMYFRVPEDFEYAPSYKFEKEINGMKVNRVPFICWFTNIEHGRRHQPLNLMTQEDNIKYSKHKEIKNIGYKRYDNFDAIEVNYFDAIPSDYNGMMGVSLTYMDKYCPEQFEIVGITQSWFGMASKIYPKQIQVSKTGKKTVVTKLNDGASIRLESPKEGEVNYIVDGVYYSKCYARILIRKKQ